MSAIEIKPLNASPDIREALSEILVEAVASGAQLTLHAPPSVRGGWHLLGGPGRAAAAWAGADRFGRL